MVCGGSELGMLFVTKTFLPTQSYDSVFFGMNEKPNCGQYLLFRLETYVIKRPFKIWAPYGGQCVEKILAPKFPT